MYKNNYKKTNILTRNQTELLFSEERMKRYFLTFPNDENKCIELYIANKKMSESFYCSLGVLEITLRNAIHRELSILYERPDWYMCWEDDDKMLPLWKKIKSAKVKLSDYGKPHTTENVISELTFGFWTSLFNATYQHDLWKQLKFVFPKIPKKQRKRNVVAKKLNKIRNRIRNRIYHYEPIIWNKEVIVYHNDIYILLEWLEPRLIPWIEQIDNFPDTYNDIITRFPSIAPQPAEV